MTLEQFISLNLSEQDQSNQQFTFTNRNLFQMKFQNTQWNSSYQFSGSVQIGDVVQFQPIQLAYVKNVGTTPIGISGILAYSGGMSPAVEPIAVIGIGGVFLQYNPNTIGFSPGVPGIPNNVVGGYNSLFVANGGSAATAIIQFWLGG